MTVDRQASDTYAPVVGTTNGPTSTGPLLVGVDVGGTKIAVLITTPDGAILGRATRASSAGDQDGAAEAIATTVEVALAEAGANVRDVAVIGVGVPGRVDPQMIVPLAVFLLLQRYFVRGLIAGSVKG